MLMLQRGTMSHLVPEWGNRYGRLLVISRARNATYQHKGACWLCKCDCGANHVVLGYHLRAGLTRSCGCARFKDKP